MTIARPPRDARARARRRLHAVGVLASTIVVLFGLAIGMGAQAARIAWACPRHPEEIASKEGSCSICGLPLEPVHLESEWTCPEHAAIAQDGPGKCPICKRDLFEVAVTRYYTCPQSVLHELEPGNCADGELRLEVKNRPKNLAVPRP